MQISIGSARKITRNNEELLQLDYVDSIEKEDNTIIYTPELQVSLSTKPNGYEYVTIEYQNKKTEYYLGKKGNGLLAFAPQKTNYLQTFTKLVKRFGKMKRVDIKERLTTFKELFKKDNISKIEKNELKLNFKKDYEEKIQLPIN